MQSGSLSAGERIASYLSAKRVGRRKRPRQTMAQNRAEHKISSFQRDKHKYYDLYRLNVGDGLSRVRIRSVLISESMLARIGFVARGSGCRYN